jgi:hypothetical protein
LMCSRCNRIWHSEECQIFPMGMHRAGEETRSLRILLLPDNEEDESLFPA